mmetsp:Transcript_42552/g.46186  ORF Transcript_42552/g.46186 Transcript_42552/m.46186 type:complete len:95 (+) Transcript_42552:352-636(+)
MIWDGVWRNVRPGIPCIIVNIEYATHCGATVLSRPEGVGFNQTYGGSTTVFWYLNDTKAFEMGKEADIFMYSGSNWEALYASHGERCWINSNPS